MAAPAPARPTDQTLRYESFSDPLFLRSNPPLNESSVLEYFYNSKFFDVNSLNQRRRRGLRVAPEADGIAYKVVASNAAGLHQLPQPFDSPWNYPNQFGVHVIQRARRHNGVEAPEVIYYCAGGTIYQAPSLASVLMHRLESTCTALDKSLQELESMLHWSVLSGYHWKAELEIVETLEQILGKQRDGGTEENEDSSSFSDSSSSSDEDAVEAIGELEAEIRTMSLDGVEPMGVPLSSKVIKANDEDSAISVMYQPREISHASEVIGREFQSLFKASSRLGEMVQAELAQRGETEVARRNTFGKYHESINRLQDCVYQQVTSPETILRKKEATPVPTE